jgi:hypothetical protein
MSGPIVNLARSEPGNLNDSPSISETDLRDERGVLRPLNKEPAEMEGQRIQEDISTVVALSGNAVPGSRGSSTSTTTQLPADEAAVLAQRDRERILALKLLDLEWTSLSPDVQQAVVVLLHALTKGQ